MVKKLRELSDKDIDAVFQNDPGYGGSVSKDRLPSSLPKKFYVVNMQNENDGSGTHWILLDNRNPKTVVFSDSMGEVPPRSVKTLMTKTHKPQTINKFQLQPIGSSSCGWWCIMTAQALAKGMPLSDFISHFSMNDPPKNDQILAKHFKS